MFEMMQWNENVWREYLSFICLYFIELNGKYTIKTGVFTSYNHISTLDFWVLGAVSTELQEKNNIPRKTKENKN
jgi:hypothetical protein